MRIKGPSQALNTGVRSVQEGDGIISSVGEGVIKDFAPIGTSFTYFGLASGVYEYWGHAWSSSGWSSYTKKQIHCKQDSYQINASSGAPLSVKIETFTAQPIVVVSGQVSKLAWSSSGTKSCAIKNKTTGGIEFSGGNTSGEISVTPNQTTVYQLSYLTSSGSEIVKTLTVATVSQGKELYYNFGASSKEVCEHSIKNTFGIVATCSIGGGCSFSGGPPTATLPSANPLRWGACINPLGTSTTESASSSSSVELSAITAFYSKQSSIVLGKTASLFWSVNPNYQCSIKNLTTGVVELQIVTSSGVKIISPKQTTRYSLSCFKKEDPTVAPLEQSLVVSVIKADIAPKVNKMSCDNQVSSSLKSGDVACYGIWDREDDFGGDKNICWSSQGGCRVTAKACSSSGATLKEVIEIGKASPESLEQVATKLGVTTSVLQNSAIKVWVYACDGAVQTFSTSSISLNAENTHYGSILGATTECVDVQSSMLSLESTDATHRGDVSKVQRFLQEKGYFFRDITGYYGGYTKKAVEKYQTSKNITPSGNIGTTTKLLIKNDTCG